MVNPSRPYLVSWWWLVAGSANEYDGSVLAEQGDVVAVLLILGWGRSDDWSYFGAEYEGSASNGIRDKSWHCDGSAKIKLWW